MHTEIDCKTPAGEVSKQTFKVDTGADGNLIPITMFAKLFSKVSLNTLEKTIESGVNLYAYNNMPIRQFGVCSLKLSFKSKTAVCKFYVMEHATAILGISDSEKLGLVRVNSDMIDKSSSVKLVHNIISETFKKEIETEFPELFREISCMEGEISIKLCDGAMSHTEPIRRVQHAMQQPLKDELDKLCKEKILHKVDISEPIEWLNSFV